MCEWNTRCYFRDKEIQASRVGYVPVFLVVCRDLLCAALGVQQENIHFLWLCHSGDVCDAPTAPVPLPPARPPARDSPKHSSLLNRTPSDYDLLVPPLGCRLFADYM